MLNKIFLMGRLTADPEYRQTPNGISVATFSLAVDRDFAAKGAERETDFINVVVWRNTADFVHKYFSKGKMMIVGGSLQTRRYEDKAGNKRTAYDVVAENVYFGESKATTGQSTSTNFSTPPSPPKTNFEPTVGSSFSIGDIGEFEEIDEDIELPF